MQHQLLHALHASEVGGLKSEGEKRSDGTIGTGTGGDSRLTEGQRRKLLHVLMRAQQQPCIATNSNRSGGIRIVSGGSNQRTAVRPDSNEHVQRQRSRQ